MPRRGLILLTACAVIVGGCGNAGPLASPGQPPPSSAVATRAAGYPEQPAGVPFPTSSWPEGDLPREVDRATIDAAVDRAFGAADASARVQSVVVVHGGRIVYEGYHPLDGPDVVYPSFSVAKSITSALIGLLVSDGELTLDDPAPVPEWQRPGDSRRAITLRHLLQMSSGLEWEEVYEAGADPIEMLGAPDAAAYVAGKPVESEPGTTFEYSTGTTALLAGIAADTLGGCRQARRYLRRRLFAPLGITSERLQLDPNGCWYGGLGADMTTRDFARFGLLFLRGGRWDGEQILPTSWVDESRTPAPTNPVYGLHWWLDPDGESLRAEGLFGQRIIVVPALDLVVATNTTPGGDPGPLVDTVLAAFRGDPIPPPEPAPEPLPAPAPPPAPAATLPVSR